MGKKFIAVKTKFYKNSNASGEMGHVDRLFAENINSFPEYSDQNFGSDHHLFDRYKELHKQRNNIRKAREDATTFVDAVLVFSLDQWEFLEDKYSPESLKKGMKKMMDDYLLRMKNEYGLEPIGYKFHLDEGHIKQFEAYQNQQDRLAKGLVPDDEEIIKKEDLTRNIHAHVLFYNFDFEKKCSPWRKVTKKQTSQMQDIAHECFKKAGFERGISKEITQKRGLEKAEHIIEKLKQDKQEQRKEIKQLQAEKAKLQDEVVTLTNDKAELQNDKAELQNDVVELEAEKSAISERYDALKGSLSRLFETFEDKLGKLVKSLLKRDLESIYDQIDDVQNSIDAGYDDFGDSIGDRMANDANEVAEKHYGDRPFKKNRPTK